MNKDNKDMVFDSGLECIDKCPFDNVINFELHRNVSDKLEYLQDQFKDVEFIVYGNSEKIENENKYILKEIYIPKQKVGHANVDDVKIENNYDTVLHKHPGDEPYGFSYDDSKYINSNHSFSILIGSKNLCKIIGIARIKTDCGRYFMHEMNVILGNRDIADQKFLDDIKNIQVGKSIVSKIVDKLWGSP